MQFPQRENVQGEFKGSGKFIRIQPGAEVKVVLVGELYAFWIKWVNGKSVVVKKGDPQAKAKFRINAVVFEEGRFVAKILEFGPMLYDQFANYSRGMDLSTVKLLISRTGSGLASEYEAVPLLKEPLSQDILAKIKAVELNVLNTEPKEKETQSNGWDGSHDFGPPPEEIQDEDRLPF